MNGSFHIIGMGKKSNPATRKNQLISFDSEGVPAWAGKGESNIIKNNPLNTYM